MSYKSPILDEIYVEFYINSDSAQDASLNFLEIVRKSGFKNVIFPNETQETTQSLLTHNPNFIRCWDETESKLIQISSKIIVLNAVGKYKGWDDFILFFKSGVDLLKQADLFQFITALSLNTIDRLRVNISDFVLHDYISCNGEIIPKWYENSKFPIDIHLGNGIPGANPFNKQVKVAGRTAGDTYFIELVVRVRNEMSIPEESEKKLIALYNESKMIFEEIITDKVRDIMNS